MAAIERRRAKPLQPTPKPGAKKIIPQPRNPQQQQHQQHIMVPGMGHVVVGF